MGKAIQRVLGFSPALSSWLTCLVPGTVKGTVDDSVSRGKRSCCRLLRVPGELSTNLPYALIPLDSHDLFRGPTRPRPSWKQEAPHVHFILPACCWHIEVIQWIFVEERNYSDIGLQDPSFQTCSAVTEA